MTDLAGTIKRSARSLLCTPLNSMLNRIDPPVIVLLYHRVTSLPSDPEMLAVTPENFRAQLLHLKKTVPIIRFEDDWKKVQRPAAVVTFDDGYADNALEALPILKEVGVPATFFVSTGSIGTESEFWWHELERLILEQRDLPKCFTLDDETCGRSWPTATLTERQELYHGIMRLMNDVDAERRNNWLGQVRCWAGTKEKDAGRHRLMSVDELRLLAGSSLVTIGAHTVTHTRLSSLSRNRQREEITTSKQKLEAWLGKEIPIFSYPFGRRSDYTQETIALCRQAGFARAAANFPGQAHRWTDPYQIPRHLVRNWPAEVFAEKLRGFWTR
jgi:peptidoglycan/xylan/chitin deacetylase (PgdA/CDA1 family)